MTEQRDDRMVCAHCGRWCKPAEALHTTVTGNNVVHWCAKCWPKRPVFGITPPPAEPKGCMDGGGRMLR